MLAMFRLRYLIAHSPRPITKPILRHGGYPTKLFKTSLQTSQPRRLMSLIPQFHRGGLSAVSRMLDNYDNMFSNLDGRKAYAPSFDVRETEKAFYLDGELPGVQQKDLKIEFENEHCLNIMAHSERESTSEKGSWWVSERSVGDFRRTFNFPATVDQEHTQAHLKNGVLSLEVPKVAQTHNKKKVDILD